MIFWTKSTQKKVFPVEKRKSEHHHGILHIRISLSTKFTQKGYFHWKTEQAVVGLQAFSFCLVNVNSTVVFKHFKDLKNLIILNNLKEKSFASWGVLPWNFIKIFKQQCVNSHDCSKAMIKFRSNFQFLILLQFYRTAEKVTKNKLVMVIVKSHSWTPSPPPSLIEGGGVGPSKNWVTWGYEIFC